MRLSPEDRDEVRAKLDELARESARDAARGARIATPRLADPRQAADFRKHVTELGADATL